MKHINLKITGKVQGVFFRAKAKKQAEAIGVVGFIRNEDDGSVYCEIEGEESLLNDFIQWCHEGPELATVEGLIQEEEEGLKEFTDFSIRV